MYSLAGDALAQVVAADAQVGRVGVPVERGSCVGVSSGGGVRISSGSGVRVSSGDGEQSGLGVGLGLALMQQARGIDGWGISARSGLAVDVDAGSGLDGGQAGGVVSSVADGGSVRQSITVGRGGGVRGGGVRGGAKVQARVSLGRDGSHQGEESNLCDSENAALYLSVR